MSDTLATINVDQLSNAVNAVVQAVAVDSLSLDPSPSPSPESHTSIPNRHSDGHVDTSAAVGQGPGAILSLPGEAAVPTSSIPSAQLTTPVSSQQNNAAATIQVTAASSSLSSTPTAFQAKTPNLASPKNPVRIAPKLPAAVTLNPFTQPQKQMMILKQIGNNVVLVPVAAQCQPGHSPVGSMGQVSSGSMPQGRNTVTLMQPAAGNNDTLYAGNLVQGVVPPAVYAQQSMNSATTIRNGQPSPLINMNIAFHVPSQGAAPSLIPANQSNGSGPQNSVRPARARSRKRSSRLVPKVVNLAPGASNPYQNNSAHLMLAPNQAVASHMPMGPLLSPTPSAIGATIDTPNDPSDLGQLSSNSGASSLLTPSISTLNLMSPTGGLTSHGQVSLLSPLTSLKPLQVPSGQPVSSHMPVGCQRMGAKRGRRRSRSQARDSATGSGPAEQRTLQDILASLKGRSADLTSDLTVSSSVSRGHRNRGESEQDIYMMTEGTSGDMSERELDQQRQGTIVMDKPVQSRARQSLPDMLSLKPSTLDPKALGVFTKQVIQPNTRFGPLVGQLSSSQMSREHDVPEAQSWNIYSSGKPTLVGNVLHTDDENTSNWMMFVKLVPQRGQHNLLAFQSGIHIYFSSCQLISVGQELIVSYSKEYNQFRGVREKCESGARCGQCGQRFGHDTQLAQHLRYCQQADDDAPPVGRRFRCELCPRSFTSSTKLNLHLLVHMGLKPHRCEVCGKAFTDRSNMKAHLLVHTGVKRFACPVCHKSFRQKIHLKSHLVTHSGEKTLQCPICKKSFGRHSDVSYHIKQHTEGKKIVCQVCNTSFWKKSQLVRHMKIHTGERDFQCHLCGKGFITNYHLNRHLFSCEREERFNRRPWPGAVPTATLAEGLAPMDVLAVEEERLARVPSRRKGWKQKLQEEPSPPPVLRSSRGRPIRPRILPNEVTGLDHALPKSKRRHRATAVAVKSESSGSCSRRFLAVPGVRSSDPQSRQGLHYTCSSSSSIPPVALPRRSEVTRRMALPGSAQMSVAVYGVQDSTLHVRGQQSSSTLSQLALTVPQESPMSLDCDTFSHASVVNPSQLEPSYSYPSASSTSEMHESPLTAPLFDLGEGSTMSAGPQSMAAYNPQSFSLSDSHTDSFSETQVHCSTPQPLFMTESTLPDSTGGTSGQGCISDHPTPATTLTEDSLFGIDPGEGSSSAMPQPTGDGMDDITVDLHAIEGALDSDDDQCTDERRGDLPSEHIEE
ncbi:uncharacterized protein [Diadema antillarum]|uniref:uncharacterized protein n=1 Tax=Diadema antillarum TaxID=105358 RepID=UPI003A8AB94E